MLLLNLGNRGLNLWCVEKAFIGLTSGKAKYETQKGTLDILNVIYTQPTLASVSFSTVPAGGVVSGTAITALRVAVKFSAEYTGKLYVSSSQDGFTFETQLTVASDTYYPGTYYWFELDPSVSAPHFSVTGLAPFPAVSDIQVATALYDLPMNQWSRDTYSAINAKNQPGHPSTSYFFEKKLTPTLTVWPVPDLETCHLTIYRHRQPQDVGTLIQQLEVPQRWLDGIIWLLAARLCFELPTVDSNVAQMVVNMADKQVFEAEQSETDGAPMFLTPRISAYTK